MEARAELPQANNSDAHSASSEPSRPTTPPVNTSAAAPESTSTPATPADAFQSTVSEAQVKLALRRVKDPDLHLNIVDLGLVYNIRVDTAVVTVDVTLTSPACPSGPEIISSMEQEVRAVPGVESVQVNLIWTPFWTPDRIEPRVRAYLGL